MTRPRHAAGTREGGRFAAKAHAEASGGLATVDPFTAAGDRAAEDARARRQERYDAMAADFRRQGANVTSMKGLAHGYVVVAAERDDALAAGQVALGAFGGDHEAGLPTLSLESEGADGWSMSVEAPDRDTSPLSPEQRVARTAALQDAWEQLEAAKQMGWVNEMTVVVDRPGPDEFRVTTNGPITGRAMVDVYRSADSGKAAAP